MDRVYVHFVLILAAAGLEVSSLRGDMESDIGLTHEEAYRCDITWRSCLRLAGVLVTAMPFQTSLGSNLFKLIQIRLSHIPRIQAGCNIAKEVRVLETRLQTTLDVQQAWCAQRKQEALCSLINEWAVHYAWNR